MSECDPIELRRGTVAVIPTYSGDPASPTSSGQNMPPHGAVSAGPAGVVAFDRYELREILKLYGRKVAEGEWRDYALDFTPHHAVFSIFRRSSEVPLYRIEKDPKLGHRQGAYRVVVAGGQILKRGRDLAHVIGVLDRRLKIVT